MKHCLIWLLFSALVVVTDQASKYLALTHLTLLESVPVMSNFNLRLVYNIGGAFSFLSEAGGWQRWFFIVYSSIVSAVVLIWLCLLPAHKYCLSAALSLILGGALGNLLDRVKLGYVIDFIDLYYNNWSWPTFNFADSAICLGAFFFLIDILWSDTSNGK